MRGVGITEGPHKNEPHQGRIAKHISCRCFAEKTWSAVEFYNRMLENLQQTLNPKP